MKKTKKIRILAVAIALIICMLTVGVFANSSTADVKNGSIRYGTVYINAKSYNIYADTVADSSGIKDDDYVYVQTGVGYKMNEGINYTTEYVSVDGSFSDGDFVVGAIKRDTIYSTGSTTATINWAE